MQQAGSPDTVRRPTMASHTESRSLDKSASPFKILPQTIDATFFQNPETSKTLSSTNSDQIVAHHHFIQNTASEPAQPPTTDFQASQSDSTKNVSSRQNKPLNPKATIFIPAQLEYLYEQHRNAYLRQKLIDIDMEDIQEMLKNGEPGEFDFERLEEVSRELANKYVFAGNERAKWITAIENQYGPAALGGRSVNFREDRI